MAHLFGRDKSVISRHIKNVFSEKELGKKAVVAKFAQLPRFYNFQSSILNFQYKKSSSRY
jgi:hypothetical protein